MPPHTNVTRLARAGALCLASLLSSDEGRSAIRLADLGVARLLEQCAGRRSWRVQDGYCIPMTPDGRPDGFRVKASD